MSAPEAPKDAPSKSAVPPVMVKKTKRGDDEDEGGGAKGTPVKQGFLPTGLSRAIVIAGILAVIAVAMSVFGQFRTNRFELVAAPNSPNSSVYRLDRVTGEILFCGPVSCTSVPTGTGDK